MIAEPQVITMVIVRTSYLCHSTDGGLCCQSNPEAAEGSQNEMTQTLIFNSIITSVFKFLVHIISMASVIPDLMTNFPYNNTNNNIADVN